MCSQKMRTLNYGVHLIMTDWLLMQSKINKEDFLCGEIFARGTECYCPKIQVRPVNPRARKVRPFFPSYIFVHIETRSAVARELRWLPGAAGWVYFGAELASVPDTLINGIRHQVDEINANGGAASLNQLKHGEVVEIIEGPFTGYKAVFDAHLSGNERVRVLLQLVASRQISLELHTGLLKTRNRGKV